jgi:sugar phosphate permease
MNLLSTVTSRRVRSRWSILAILTAAYGAGAFGVLGASPLSPFLLRAFALTRVEIGLLLPAVYLSGLVFSLPAGRLADRFGPRSCLLGGLLLAGAMLVAGALVPTFPALLACLIVAGIGWSVMNPALGKAIVDLFPPNERGLAMGIKQMGLTVGGIGSALVLPIVASRSTWRSAMIVCGAVVIVPGLLGWRPLAVVGRGQASARDVRPARADLWWWTRRPPLLVFCAAGFGLGLTQAALMGFLPIFATQQLGLTPVAAGGLLAAAQAGGAVARVVLGLTSDRSFGGARAPWLVFTSALTAATFGLFAWLPPAAPLVAGLIGFGAGVGALGWVGLYLVIGAEVGGPAQAGLLTGVAMACLIAGILVGSPVFGVLLEATDSYRIAWTAFAILSLSVAAAFATAGGAIHRERHGSRHESASASAT